MDPTPQSPSQPGPADGRAQAPETAAQLRLFDPDGGLPRWLRLPLAAWMLAVSGDRSLAVWAAVAVEALLVRYGRNERTAATVVAEARRLFRYLRNSGVEKLEDLTRALVLGWCWAARPDRGGRLSDVSAATARQRQWIALVCFEELAKRGAPIDPAALVGPRVARPDAQVSARPLNSGEADLVRSHADSGLMTSRRPPQVAAAFAGGTATEIALLRLRDLDLAAGTVTFSGDTARTNPLDGWSIETFGRWLLSQPQTPDSDALVCVSEGLGLARGARSVSVRLGDVLRDAGLMGRPGVTARSIRLTTARQVLDGHGIEAAARFLGAVSLDTTAAALQHPWRDSDA